MAAKSKKRVRFAVAGPGHIAQVAVLPAFAHARATTELAAIISDDAKKAKVLAKKYKVDAISTYDDMEACLAENAIDALYIALPNHLHHTFAIRAAKAGVHVLCEKPMAVDEDQCLEMIAAAKTAGVKLMIAYRLHFQKTHLAAIEIARSKRLGEIRTIHADLTLTVKDPGNIRRGPRDLGGGPLYDLGIYCINASRYIFRDEPLAVSAFRIEGTTGEKPSELTLCGMLRFPKDRISTFHCSVGAAPLSTLRVLGTKGDLYVESAFDYAEGMTQRLTINQGKNRTKVTTFAKQDQFAPELIYFADCIRSDREPQPSGREGLMDVRIIRALHAAAESGKVLDLQPMDLTKRPTLAQEISRPPVRQPDTFHAASPTD